MKISVAIAAYNEEKNIEECIRSAKNVADEIVIADGKSKDKTASIATALGAKVIFVENDPMFHKNKNIAIKHCRGDWLLVLDADERVTDELAKEIKKTVKENPKQNGFFVNRKNWFLGDYLKKGGAYPDSVIRLFRRGKGIHEEVTVHEQIKINGSVGYLKNDLLHIADPNFERYLVRANRYTNETALKLKEKGVSKNIFSFLNYTFFKPAFTFFDIFIRHRGYADGFRGFVWALFSSLHHFIAYSKYITAKDQK